jgi:hypothetical protein
MGRAKAAGLRPSCVLLDEAEIVMSEKPKVTFCDAALDAEEVFGVPFRSSDGFAVLCDGYLSVWKEEPCTLTSW